MNIEVEENMLQLRNLAQHNMGEKICMNVFNENEFNDICKKLKVSPVIKDVTIKYTNSGFFNKIRASVQRDRRGEAVFCVIRPNGKIIAITCSEYPQGIFRIPTGGIGHNEDIIEAVYRETMEELGLVASIEEFGGVIRISFEHENESVMFYSYVFILRETSGRLLEDASDDEVSEVREIGLGELEGIVGELYNIQGKWRDWGKFRYVTSAAVLEFLRTGRHAFQIAE